MMETVIGICLALAIGAYAWLVLGRTKAGTFPVIRTLAALLFGLSVLDIWSTTAMVVLHLAACFLLLDLIGLFIRAEAWKRISEWLGNLNYGLYELDGCTAIVSSGFAGWGYDVRTQGHCEYVIVDITTH